MAANNSRRSSAPAPHIPRTLSSHASYAPVNRAQLPELEEGEAVLGDILQLIPMQKSNAKECIKLGDMIKQLITTCREAVRGAPEVDSVMRDVVERAIRCAYKQHESSKSSKRVFFTAWHLM